jgi:DNA replication protein DnaC
VQGRIKKAQFPSLKTLDSFDFPALPLLDKKRVMELMEGTYIEKAENVLALGNSGTGKMRLALALGMNACQKGYSVLFKTAVQLVHELTEAHDTKKFLNLQKKLKGYKLLIIDELGYVPFSKTGAELLFEVFSQRYEQGSLIVTSNLPFEEWPQVFGCSRLTGALLDRLTHYVHILEMNGSSYRLASRSFLPYSAAG